MKKLLSVLFSFTLIFCVFSFCSFGVSAEGTGGYTGEIMWSLSETELTLSGNGATADYEYSKNKDTKVTTAPWGTGATKVVIEEGVTKIGENAFIGCNELKTVEYRGTEAQKAALEIAESNEPLINAEWVYSRKVINEVIPEPETGTDAATVKSRALLTVAVLFIVMVALLIIANTKNKKSA